MIYTNEMIKNINLKKEKRKKIVKIIFFPVLLILIFFVLNIFFQKFVQKKNNINFFGVKPLIVMTGSMEPNYNIGDLIIVKEIAKENININDVITYSLENGKDTVTHRVVEIVNQDGETMYRTKGDNNNSADSELVKYSQVQGTIFLKIDKIGAFITKFITGAGIVTVLIIFAAVYMYSSKEDEKRLEREYARKMYNVPKYKKEESIWLFMIQKKIL